MLASAFLVMCSMVQTDRFVGRLYAVDMPSRTLIIRQYVPIKRIVRLREPCDNVLNHLKRVTMNCDPTRSVVVIFIENGQWNGTCKADKIVMDTDWGKLMPDPGEFQFSTPDIPHKPIVPEED